jgi:hypothetical protein
MINVTLFSFINIKNYNWKTTYCSTCKPFIIFICSERVGFEHDILGKFGAQQRSHNMTLKQPMEAFHTYSIIWLQYWMHFKFQPSHICIIKVWPSINSIWVYVISNGKCVDWAKQIQLTFLKGHGWHFYHWFLFGDNHLCVKA